MQLIWQLGWTGRQLLKDSDRATTTMSAMATPTLCDRTQHSSIVGDTKNQSTAIATPHIDSELLQSAFVPAQVPDASGISKLSQPHVVLVFICGLSPAALGDFHKIR